MKSARLIFASAVAVLFQLNVSVPLSSQEAAAPTAKYHHYKFIDLGTLGGPSSVVNEVFYEIDDGTAGARMVSDQGVVAGQADTSTPDPLCFLELDSSCLYSRAFRWQRGTLTDLGALPGAQWSSPNWVSGNGLIAGASLHSAQRDPFVGVPQSRAVLWRDDQIIDLGTLPGGSESFAWGVNDRGQVVGDATNNTVDPYSYLYATIVGISNGTQTRAFLWDQRNGMQDLGTLGGPDAWAAMVNEQGQVTGISYTSATPNPDNGLTCAANVPPSFGKKHGHGRHRVIRRHVRGAASHQQPRPGRGRVLLAREYHHPCFRMVQAWTSSVEGPRHTGRRQLRGIVDRRRRIRGRLC